MATARCAEFRTDDDRLLTIPVRIDDPLIAGAKVLLAGTAYVVTSDPLTGQNFRGHGPRTIRVCRAEHYRRPTGAIVFTWPEDEPVGAREGRRPINEGPRRAAICG